MPRFSRAATAVLAFSWACTNEPTQVTRDYDVGSVTFDITGAHASAFNATGGRRTVGSHTSFRSYAFATADGGPFWLYGQHALSTPFGDVASIELHGPSMPGSTPIEYQPDPHPGAWAWVRLAFNTDVVNERPTVSADTTWHVELKSGQFTITSIDSSRARGSFAGSGIATFSFGTSGGSFAVTVTNGQFDVPLIPSAEVW